MPSRLMGGGRGAGDPAGEGRADMAAGGLQASGGLAAVGCVDVPRSDVVSMLSTSDLACGQLTEACSANSQFAPVDNSGDRLHAGGACLLYQRRVRRRAPTSLFLRFQAIDPAPASASARSSPPTPRTPPSPLCHAGTHARGAHRAPHPVHAPRLSLPVTVRLQCGILRRRGPRRAVRHRLGDGARRTGTRRQHRARRAQAR